MEIDFSEALGSLRNMGQGFVERLPYLVTAAIVFFIFWAVAKGVRKLTLNLTGRYTNHRNLGLVLGRLSQGTIVFLGLMISLVIALPNFQPAQLIQLLGISSVAIGFAFKDIFQNFLAGILLLLNEPFKIGDQIRVGEFEGTVEDIQTRATIIKTYDARRVVVPNGDLFNQSVVVNTAYPQRRIQYDFGVGYGDDLEKAKAVILQTLYDQPEVLDDPAPDVLTYDLGPSTVNLRARWWIAPPRRADDLATRDRVLTAVKRKLTEHGIDLPFPTQVLLFHDQTEEDDGQRRLQREGWPAANGTP